MLKSAGRREWADQVREGISKAGTLVVAALAIAVTGLLVAGAAFLLALSAQRART
jgi:hypothetical protein